MSPRPYRLGRRQQLVDDTRERIVAAARAALIERGYYGFGLDEVARLADVTRATVYYQYGSKLGLLNAVAQDALRRADQSALHTALADPDPRGALRGALSEGSRMWAAEHEVFREVIGLGMADPELRPAALQREQRRRVQIGALAARLAAQGCLQPGWNAERATDALFLFTSFETFALLYTTCDRSLSETVERLLQLAATVVTGL